MDEDIKVINQILQGKKDYYGVLMNKYHNEIFSFVFNMLGNYQDTEDLVQEIFIKVYHSLKKYDHTKSSFRTWLYRISSNHTFNYLKSAYFKSKTSSELDTSFLVDKLDIEQEVVKDQEIQEVLKIITSKLSTKHQKIMILYYFSGFSVKEISESLIIPEKTIYKAIKSSIEKIKKEVTTNE